MKLREWLAVADEMKMPGGRRAAVSLWLRDRGDHLADGPAGFLRWRWRASLGIRRMRRNRGR